MSEHVPGMTPDLGRPQSEARQWFEPLLVVSIMLASLYFNRDRSFSVLRASPSQDDLSRMSIKQGEYRDSRSSSRSTSLNRSKEDIDLRQSTSPASRPSSPPAPMNFPSRVLQKFPFLVEMFYWALNFLAYAMTKAIGEALHSRYGDNEITEVAQLAQQHGIDVLTLEHNSIFSVFFPVTEVEFQQLFLTNHLSTMTVFNQIYSLVHIPGTVAFLSWFYHAAPSHDIFATVRRTMTLGNFAAFLVFTLYPCMPPRLLPASFGFRDTVRQEHAESVWTHGANVNELAAMPSLHFTYAFITGCTFFYQACSPWHMVRGRIRTRRSSSLLRSGVYVLAGALYPLLVLSVIVATANHYWLDAVVATLTVAASFGANRVWCVLLPAERVLCRVLRLRKPTPTTGKFRCGPLDVPDQRVRADVDMA